MNWDSRLITDIINLALDEDILFGDITTESLVDPTATGTGFIRYKQNGMVCGLPLIAMISSVYEQRARKVANQLSVTLTASEGQIIDAGNGPQAVATIKGNVQTLLTLERTFLNFLQRLSGIATQTSEYVTAAKNNFILDTRKTTPGLRVLEKYAVTVGGGKNHRSNLSELILIKNNHVDAVNGNFKKIKERLLQARAPYVPVEVEVRNMHELTSALEEILPNVIMLDNFSDSLVVDAVKHVQSQSRPVLIEISGGLTKERIQHISSKVSGVYFSVGSLTTKATNIDISMLIEPDGGMVGRGGSIT